MKILKANRIGGVVAAAALAFCLTTLGGGVDAFAAYAPSTVMAAGEQAIVDTANLANGIVSVKYTGGKNVRIKLQIAKSGGTTYSYDLNNAGNAETFPLTDGNGAYSIKVFENTTGSKYAQAYSGTVNLALSDSLRPFLYANQYVNFNAASKVTAKASEVTAGKADTIAKTQAVFDYVVDNFTYDDAFAKTVQSGYIPSPDKTLASKKGICFDYASVMASMLRSQGVPCKLIVGYAGKVYHAWISVYVSGTGWIDDLIYFDGKNWSMLDPTYLSSGKRSDSAKKYVSTPANYVQKFVY